MIASRFVRNFLIAAAAAACFSGAAHADRLADIKARGSLTCGTLTSTVPLGFQDPQTRQIVGFDVDVCAGVAKHLGVKMEHKPVTVEARIPELALGRVDLINAALGYTKERAQQIAFTSAHYQVPIRLMVPTNGAIKGFSDMAGKKISTTKGSTPELSARKVLPTAEVVTYQDSPTAFLALTQNKVNAMAITHFAGIRYVTQSEGKFRFLDQPLAWEAEAIGVKKDEPALLAAVNKALEAMEASGELEAMWVKWYGPSTPYNIPREKKLTPISNFE